MSKVVKKPVCGTDNAASLAVPIDNPKPPPPAPKPSLSGTSTTWTITTGGNFNAAGNWSNGVPIAGIDATINEASTDPITVTISGVSDTVDALDTQFAGLSITNGTLIMQGALGAGDGSNITTSTGTALNQAGGLVDFQNGPSQNNISSITSGGGGVIQTAGIIEVDAGTLNISGNSSFAGTLTGIGDKPDSGIITLGGGATYNFGSTAAISIGTLELINGATMILGLSPTFAGNFVQSNGTTLNANNHEFVLKDTAGNTSSEDGLITGGELANLSTLSMLNATLASGSIFNNGGVLLLNQGGGTAITLGTGGSAASVLENSIGGTIIAQNGSYAINGGTFTNSSQVQLASVGNISTTSSFTNRSVISIGAGDTFTTQNALNNAGTIGGAGTLAVAGGYATFSAGSTITVAQLSIGGGGATINLGTNLAYAGLLNDEGNFGSAVNVENNTLSLTGTADFGAEVTGAVALVEGTGTLALSGATTITNMGLAVAEATTLSNAGKLTQSSGVAIGDQIAAGAVINSAGGLWNIVGNSTLGSSGGNSNSTFANAGTLETTSVGETATVNAVATSTGTLSAVNGATLDFVSNLANTGNITGAGEFAITGGTTTLGTGTVLSGGTLAIGGSGDLAQTASLSYAGTLDDTSTAATGIQIGGGDTLTLSGPVFIGNGNTTTIDGPGKLSLTSANTTIANASNLVLGDGVALVNSGTVTQDGFVQLGDSSGTSASVTNSAGGTWTLATGDGVNRGTDFNTIFTNAGLFQNTALSSVAQVYAVFDNTGTLSASSAETDFYSNFVNTGTISGTGTFGLNGSGIGTLSTGTVLSVAQVDLSGQATLALGANLAYSGFWNQEGNNASALNLQGHVLTLSGKAQFGGNNVSTLVEGTGTLAVSGATTITSSYNNSGLVLGSTANLVNSGSVFQVGQVQIGDGSGALAKITNSAKGTWAISTASGLGTGSNAASSFANAGLFENIGSSVEQSINTVLANTGTISIAANDETDFNNTLSNAGTISGAGVLGLQGSSTTTFSAGETISVAEIGIYSQATLDLATNLSYGGFWNQEGNNASVVNLQGNTLSLSGKVDLGGNNVSTLVEGPGTLAVSGATTLTSSYNGSGLELGSTVAMTNSGSVLQDGQVQIGDSSGAVATITNSAAGTWALATSAGIGTGNNASSSFTNAGLLENTGTGSSPTISASFINTGTFSIGSGDQTIFTNALANTGLITGTGTLVVNAGEATFSAGSTISVAQINVFNEATLNVATNLIYAGRFIDEGNNADYLNLGSNTFSLTGSAEFGGNNQDAYVGGVGTLALSGATTITTSYNGSGLETGDSLALVNSGTVVQSGNVQIGDTSGDQASITNSATGTWSFATGNGIATGINAASSFTNAGLVRNIGAGNSVRIGSVFNNTGTLSDPNAGTTLALADGGSIAGTLSGAGEIDFDGGAFTLGTATALGIATLGIYNNGTDVTLAAATSYAGSLTLGSGATLTLNAAAAKLTLTGQDSLDGLVTGTGSLVLSTGGTLIADNLTLGNAVTLDDSGGTIAQGTNMTIGNSSASTADLAITAGSKYEITNGVTLGSDGLGAITNAGTFAMLADLNNGASTIDPLFTNTGAVISGAGTLNFAAAFINAGTATANSGALDFGAAVTNNKLITVANGNSLVIGGNLSSSGSSTGTIDLTAGGLATFGGYVGSSQTLAFTDGSSSKITIDSPSNFDGIISGFSGANALLLADFESVTGSSYSASTGVLSLTGENDQGTLTMVNLHFSGSYTLGSFALVSNNQGGLIITEATH